jgi:hypothetical protein
MPPTPFADLPPTPGTHFRLTFFACVQSFIAQIARMSGSLQQACEVFPFLQGYHDDLSVSAPGAPPGDAAAWWRDTIHAWEASVSGHLPLRALRDTGGLDDDDVTLLMTIGLVEEDSRFGVVFETFVAVPGMTRPSLGVLKSWPGAPEDLYDRVRRLADLGLVLIADADRPRTEWTLQVRGLLWDVLRGQADRLQVPWADYTPARDLLALDDLIIPETLAHSLWRLPALLAANDVTSVVVRGSQHTGRRTLLGALARELGRGRLSIDVSAMQDAGVSWSIVGALATLLNAVPVAALELGPNEVATVPRPPCYAGPLGIVLGREGGVTGSGAEQALTLTVGLPDMVIRRAMWQRTGVTIPDGELTAISERVRIAGGYIPRAARLAESYARLEGRTHTGLGDVQQACRTINRQTLDALATPVESFGDWSYLAVNAETLEDLLTLEQRCRHRERLHTMLGPALSGQLNVGVRALFSGPSGTGKTLAARILAAVLQMDLYRVNLAAVVNKYIGETEKNLDAVLARAEELDVILLLDEGDALLTQRTSVHTANDRYANLETNYLLQRLESFEGILVVTTNADDYIDEAFQRRMDVVVSFRTPEAAERWLIWQLHLPAEHAISQDLLRHISRRCALRGGQIRNSVLHASLLALEDGTVITSDHLHAAVEREYRKAGELCPLPAREQAGRNHRGGRS